MGLPHSSVADALTGKAAGENVGGCIGKKPVQTYGHTPLKAGSSKVFFYGSDLGKLAKPSDQTVLERVLRIRNQGRLI